MTKHLTPVKSFTAIALTLLALFPVYGLDCRDLFKDQVSGVERVRGRSSSLELTAFQKAIAKKQRFRVNLSETMEGPERSFSEMMMDKETGIRALTDTLIKTPIEIATAEELIEAMQFFDGGKKFKRMFEDPNQGLRDLHAMMMKEFPSGKCDYIQMEYFLFKKAHKVPGFRGQSGFGAMKLSPLIALASGHALLVELPGGHMTFHLGYYDVEANSRRTQFITDQKDLKILEIRPEKAGRSYDFIKDATDIELLKEAALAVNEGYIMETIEQTLHFAMTSKPKGMGSDSVSIESAKLATAFINVYIAEIERHATVGLSPFSHPWGTDLFLALIDSVYITASGGKMLVQKPHQKDRANLVYAKNGAADKRYARGSDGTGIGVTRDARLAQQLVKEKAIASMSEENAKLVKELHALIGSDPTRRHNKKTHELMESDLLQILFERVSHPKAEIRAEIREKAHEIIPLLLRFIALQKDPEVIKVIDKAMVKAYGKAIDVEFEDPFAK